MANQNGGLAVNLVEMATINLAERIIDDMVKDEFDMDNPKTKLYVTRLTAEDFEIDDCIEVKKNFAHVLIILTM